MRNHGLRSLSFFFPLNFLFCIGVGKITWRREWQPTPVVLPGHMDRGAWWATVHGVAKSQTDTTERLTPHYSWLRNDVLVSGEQRSLSLSLFFIAI